MDNNAASWSNGLKLSCLKVEDLKGYNPFTRLEVPLAWLYSIEPLSSSVLALEGDIEALFGSLRGPIQRNVP
ncbi:hypothetical protein Tco_0408819 [Tanacetum coccineum]